MSNFFKFRSYQVPVVKAIENDGYKRAVIILARRAGKDYMSLEIALRQALKKVCTVFYIFPTFANARKAIWDAISIEGVRLLDIFPDGICKKNTSEMKITLANGSIIQFMGATNYDRLRGTNPYMVIFSEYAQQNPMAYQTIRPILAANNGIAIFVSTPFGKNSFYDLYQLALKSDDWFCYLKTVEDTKHIPEKILAREREQMSEDMYQQEFLCFTGESLVLTPYGVKEISKINAGDYVISHKGRVRIVKKTFKRKYSGNMIKIHSYGNVKPLVCTPNHELRIYDQPSQSYSWKRSLDIKINDLLVMPILDNTLQPSIIDKNLIMLMAWYITDGSTSGNHLNISIGYNKPLDEILSYIDALSLSRSVAENKDNHIYNISIKSTKLVDLFIAECGDHSYNKRIPLHLLVGYYDEFLLELMKGDGCYVNSKKVKKYLYTTTSINLAYQIQFLANSCKKYAASIIKPRKAYRGMIEGRIVNCRESYVINIYKKLSTLICVNSHPKLITARHSVSGKVLKIETMRFSGNVYNLSVDRDETYVVNSRSVHNCSFERGVAGSVFANIINELVQNDRITNIPWDRSFPVHTSWDIGYADSTAIIFFQVIGVAINIIDFYENNQHGLEYYIKYLDSKPYKYGTHIAPHDMANHSFSTGISRIEMAANLGIDFTIAPKLSIQDGIEASKVTLSKCYIDKTKCDKLINNFNLYRYEWDDRRQMYKNVFFHGPESHAVDAFRMLSVSLHLISHTSSPKELNERYHRAINGPGNFLDSKYF